MIYVLIFRMIVVLLNARFHVGWWTLQRGFAHIFNNGGKMAEDNLTKYRMSVDGFAIERFLSKELNGFQYDQKCRELAKKYQIPIHYISLVKE